MDDRDAFAVWIADAMLRAKDQEFAADALTSLAEGASTSQELDDILKPAASGAPTRPGDFGLEILGPLIPLVLVEFGRSLWEAYVKRLAEEGGKALADLTLAKVKNLARQTWSNNSTFTITDIEQKLRDSAHKVGLDDERTNILISELWNDELKNEINRQ